MSLCDMHSASSFSSYGGNDEFFDRYICLYNVLYMYNALYMYNVRVSQSHCVVHSNLCKLYYNCCLQFCMFCSTCTCTCTCLLHCTPVAHAVKESDATSPNFFNPPPPPSPPSLSLVSTLQVTLNTVAVVTVAPHAAPLPAAVTEVSANTVHSLTVPPVNQRSPPTKCLVLAACRVEGVVVRGGVGLLVVWEVLGLHAQAGLIHVHVQFVTTTTCTCTCTYCTLVIYMYIYMYIRFHFHSV